MTSVSLGGRSVRANNIFCIGRNYAAHISELCNEKPAAPLVFLKPNSSLLQGPAKLALPADAHNVHYETELVLLIGRAADELTPQTALDMVAGLAVGLDLTERGWQRQAVDARQRLQTRRLRIGICGGRCVGCGARTRF